MSEPRIPVVAEARADLYTPLAVYLKLANGPYSYLLESVVGGERFGRYSFIGLSCTERIEARGRTVRRLLRDARGADVCLESVDSDPFEYVRAWLARNKVVPTTLRFAGGLAGYFGYEAVRHIEPRALGAEKPDAIGTPDLLLLVSDELAVLDNGLGKLYLVVYAQPGAERAARERLDGLRSRLAGALPEERIFQPGAPKPVEGKQGWMSVPVSGGQLVISVKGKDPTIVALNRQEIVMRQTEPKKWQIVEWHDYPVPSSSAANDSAQTQNGGGSMGHEGGTSSGH